jgi:hypothetical protein
MENKPREENQGNLHVEKSTHQIEYPFGLAYILIYAK